MRVTMIYDDGPWRGEVAFESTADAETLPESDRHALEHYGLTAGGLVGQFFGTGGPSPDGGCKAVYEVYRSVVNDGPPAEVLIYLRTM